MNDSDLIKKKFIGSRTDQISYTSIPVEFPIAIGNAVYLIAIHWHLEAMNTASGSHLFLAALSENPEHEANPPIGVWEFMGNTSLYGMASWAAAHEIAGTDRAAMAGLNGQVIPLYGLLRPKRQVAVFANIWAPGVTGIRGEIYYTESQPPFEIVNAISRRYGKYRRT